MTTETEDLTIVDGIKLIVGKSYLLKYAHGKENDWFECKITRITVNGHAWGEGPRTNGIITNGSYFVQTIPYASNTLIIELHRLQDHVIGLFKPNASDVLEMVVKKDGDLLKTITIGSLGGLSTTYIPMGKGVYKEFGLSRTLSDMVKNPYELDEICKSFKTK